MQLQQVFYGLQLYLASNYILRAATHSACYSSFVTPVEARTPPESKALYVSWFRKQIEELWVDD